MLGNMDQNNSEYGHFLCSDDDEGFFYSGINRYAVYLRKQIFEHSKVFQKYK